MGHCNDPYFILGTRHRPFRGDLLCVHLTPRLKVKNQASALPIARNVFVPVAIDVIFYVSAHVMDSVIQFDLLAFGHPTASLHCGYEHTVRG